MAFMGFRPGEIFNAAAEITEGTLRTAKNNPKGLLLGGYALNMAIVTGTAPKGQLASATTGAAAGEVGASVGGAVGGALGAFVPIPGASWVGRIAGGIVGYNVASTQTAKSIVSGIKNARESTHVNVGGNYSDTTTAYTMRQRAAQEMSGSLLNARQWLGKEANMYHT